jgi:hypothetical protein
LEKSGERLAIAGSREITNRGLEVMPDDIASLPQNDGQTGCCFFLDCCRVIHSSSAIEAENRMQQD